MAMDIHDAALAIAGVLGSGVAVVHGVLTQRLMVRRLQGPAGAQFPGKIRELMAALLHFTTYNWFLGGLALLVAAFAFQREAKLVTAVLVGSSYLFGGVGNLWANRGRPHPGWILYGIALLLIVYSVSQPGT
jgi:hypothetical protein